MLTRLNDDICQVRLELDLFDLAPPNADGVCETDFFLVTGGTQVPQLCGLNTGQHREETNHPRCLSYNFFLLI